MSNQPTGDQERQPEVAFYYPGPMWVLSDRVKNLLLFFDGVALLVPEYMKDRPGQIDPAVVAGLQDHGLLHILEPETLVDKQATENLAMAMTDIITSGALDPLAREGTRFQELSYSRLGGSSDPALANMIFEELKRRGLARDTEDGVSIPMHPMVRALVLVLLAQILRPKGKELGLDLSPTTDRPQLVAALTELLSLPGVPSTGHVISFDLNTVSVDLSSIPMDEVLGFRKQYLKEHRAYTRSVRQFVRELSLMEAEERAEAFEDRQSELEEIANDLKRISRKEWRKPASFSLSIAGAVWTLATGDFLGAILGAGAAAAGRESSKATETGAYSYIFRAQKEFA